MPDQERLVRDGVALHAGGLPGYPSSHGCVQPPSTFAKSLFAESHLGMTVVIVDVKTAPADVVHPPPWRRLIQRRARLEGASAHNWITVPMPGYGSGAVIGLSNDVAGRLRLPQDFARELYPCWFPVRPCL
jgi:hypothetical protein